jgi:luciferase-like monooxygenase
MAPRATPVYPRCMTTSTPSSSSEENRGPGAQIADTVSSWPEVSVAPHRFGGIEFAVGRRELGHLHGDRIADLPFPRRVRDELIAAGRARPHHVLPDSGWVTVSISGPAQVQRTIELFALAYERAQKARRPAPLTARPGQNDG